MVKSCLGMLYRSAHMGYSAYVDYMQSSEFISLA